MEETPVSEENEEVREESVQDEAQESQESQGQDEEEVLSPGDGEPTIPEEESDDKAEEKHVEL